MSESAMCIFKLMKMLFFATALTRAAALKIPIPGAGQTRRQAIMGAAAAALTLSVPAASEASYALQQAATQYQSWEATGKEREQAIYEDIQRKLDQKRPDREEAGTLGYVGGEYTKKSAAARIAMMDELEAKSVGSGSSAGYMKPEDLVMLGRAAQRVAAP